MSSRRQYPFHLIEPKWQQYWDTQQTFKAWNPGEVLPPTHPFAIRHALSGPVAVTQLPPKYYILDMFPYPSGAGLHVGHPEGYTATDILARYKRARGFNVLHPMGWDAFGLPAEQYAIKTGQHPRKTTEANIATFKRQIQSLGFSYDWTREVDTTDPGYFKWTQWIFLQLYNAWFNPETNKAEPISTLKYPKELDLLSVAKSCPPVEERDQVVQKLWDERHAYRDARRLAYVSEAPVNWCPELGTVLANEEVIDGKSEVGGFPVVRKPMRQWMLRITAYAEKLLNDLDGIDWSNSLKEMQRNWIGRSEGAEVSFKVSSESIASNQSGGTGATDSLNTDLLITVFTTRPDTLFGATYMVLSPEHRLVNSIVPDTWPDGIPAEWTRGGVQKHEVAHSPESTARKAEHFGTEVVRVADLTVDSDVLALIPGKVAHQYRAIPLRASSTSVVIAIDDPSDIISIDELLVILGREIEIVCAPSNELDVALNRLYPLTPRDVVENYRAYAATKSDLERTELAKEKTGVFTGAYAVNPVNGEKIPIWIADYVLATYGTGAIMAVPAHDERDWEFAKKFNLPIREVIRSTKPSHGLTHAQLGSEVIEVAEARSEDGTSGESFLVLANGTRVKIPTVWDKALTDCDQDAYCVHSDLLNGLAAPEAKQKIIAWLESKGVGKKTINYKLRDWLFSRQRYWGEPFPIVWKDGHHSAVAGESLPLQPPDLTDFKPTSTGEPPLARAKDWVSLPDGSVRETNTMPQWAGSCWYYLRYLDARNASTFCSKEAEGYWMGGRTGFQPVPKDGVATSISGSLNQRDRLPACPTPGVDLYVGGTEHAVLHLLYARFWHKVLFDLGHVSTPEPFFKLVNQGLILGEDGQKMSKARGNVVNPDAVVEEYGADSLRLYEMFMGPLEMVKPWNTKGVEGVYRFLGRVWRLFIDDASETEFEQAETTASPDKRGELLQLLKIHPAITDVQPTPAQLKTLHACIKKVTEDLDALRFNTGISALMVFVNEAMTWETRPASVLRTFLQLLAPFSPHVAEELWAKLHAKHSAFKSESLVYAPWPQFDPALLVEDTLEIPVQVNGKLRDKIVVPAKAPPQELEAAALKAEKVQAFLEGKTVKKVIVIPGRLVNIVAV